MAQLQTNLLEQKHTSIDFFIVLLLTTNRKKQIRSYKIRQAASICTIFKGSYLFLFNNFFLT